MRSEREMAPNRETGQDFGESFGSHSIVTRGTHTSAEMCAFRGVVGSHGGEVEHLAGDGVLPGGRPWVGAKWTAEEDDILLDYVERYGPTGWASVAWRTRKAFSRGAEACKKRWSRLQAKMRSRGAVPPGPPGKRRKKGGGKVVAMEEEGGQKRTEGSGAAMDQVEGEAWSSHGREMRGGGGRGEEGREESESSDQASRREKESSERAEKGLSGNVTREIQKFLKRKEEGEALESTVCKKIEGGSRTSGNEELGERERERELEVSGAVKEGEEEGERGVSCSHGSHSGIDLNVDLNIYENDTETGGASPFDRFPPFLSPPNSSPSHPHTSADISTTTLSNPLPVSLFIKSLFPNPKDPLSSSLRRSLSPPMEINTLSLPLLLPRPPWMTSLLSSDPPEKPSSTSMASLLLGEEALSEHSGVTGVPPISDVSEVATVLVQLKGTVDKTKREDGNRKRVGEKGGGDDGEERKEEKERREGMEGEDEGGVCEAGESGPLEFFLSLQREVEADRKDWAAMKAEREERTRRRLEEVDEAAARAKSEKMAETLRAVRNMWAQWARDRCQVDEARIRETDECIRVDREAQRKEDETERRWRTKQRELASRLQRQLAMVKARPSRASMEASEG